MKSFKFKQNALNEKNIDNNGWLFKYRIKKNFGVFSLTTPVIKEVTFSKGPTVRYQKHRAFGIGILNSNNELSGLVFFDPHIRILIFLFIMFGVAYASFNIFFGIIFASLFYLLFLMLSFEDDEKLLCQCKIMFETGS